LFEAYYKNKQKEQEEEDFGEAEEKSIEIHCFE